MYFHFHVEANFRPVSGSYAFFFLSRNELAYRDRLSRNGHPSLLIVFDL